MLKKSGEYILAGRFQAIIVTSVLSMLGLVVPLLTYIGSGLVPALVTLRKSTRAGLEVIAGSIVLTLILVMIAGTTPYVVAALCLGVWLPVWCSASALRLTESQGKMLVVAALFGLVYLVATHLVLEDVTGWWREWLNLWLDQVASPANREKMAQLPAVLAPVMNAMTAAGIYISLVSTVLLARWWQAYLFNRGGFQQEFHALQVPRQLVFVVAADMLFILATEAQRGSLAMDCMLLLMVVYLFQGLAGIHRHVTRRKMSRTWLTGMYIFLFLLPQTILFVACFGMIDSWLMQKGTDRTNDNS